MRKLLVLFTGILAMILLAACGGSKDVDESTAEEYTTVAKNVITLLNDHDYEKVFNMFDKEMEAGLPLSQMDELTPVIDESGDFQKIKDTSIEKKGGYYIIVLAAEYSQKDRIYTITLKSNKEIAGLYIK